MSEYIARMTSDMPYELKAELNAWFINSEPIVRCRDCEYSINDRECSRPDEVYDEHWFAIEPDGFCAWGEKKES